mmetsp:Transcript_23454/g.55566  ORF Transcript_23454/g.55566 Transcript_23454/m.55566 type:complete len:116 (+) Transcript_23454:80-427(+)
MVKLLRYQIFLVYGAIFLATWWMLLSRLPTSTLSAGEEDEQQQSIAGTILIRYLPIFAILLLGVYAASSVIYGVMIFKDTPEASTELDLQITEAKQEMTKRGVIITDEDDSKKDQ